MATPHIESNKEDIADIVLMPGDPLRAQFIAENFLENYKKVNTIRNIFGFTGYYKGKKITVFASGMGIPSIGIYSYELFKFYDVKTIIRIGSAGAYTDSLNVYDILLVEDAYSESTYALNQNGYQSNILESSKEINSVIENIAADNNINIKKGRVHSSDIFYKPNDNFKEIYEKYNCLACEMETFGLFQNAKLLNKNAAALVTISNSLVTNEEVSSEEREKNFTKMIELALETAIKL